MTKPEDDWEEVLRHTMAAARTFQKIVTDATKPKPVTVNNTVTPGSSDRRNKAIVEAAQSVMLKLKHKQATSSQWFSSQDQAMLDTLTTAFDTK